MNHAITCHLPTATVLLIASLFGVRKLYPNREFSTQEIVLISTVILVVSLSITGALQIGRAVV